MAQKKKSARQRIRSQARHNFWTQSAASLPYGREQFRFRLYRTARRLPALDIDAWVEHCNWQRESGTRTAELTFRRPLGPQAATMIANGDEVRCEVSVWGAGGGWKTLWRLKVDTPNHQIKDGIMSVALAAALEPLTKSKVAWKFRKGKGKPNGWTADQITRNVCARFDVKIGSLPKGHHRIDKLVEKSLSGLDVIVRAWKAERTATGRRFDVDISRGVLTVTELREPRYMLLLGDAILDATVEQSFGSMATAIIATATRKSGGKAKKLRVRVVDQRRRRKYGYIVKTKKAPKGIDSTAELRKWAKKELARTHMPRKAVSFSHPGIPFVDRGDAIRLKLPESEFGTRLVFVTSVRHDVSAGSYTMDVTVSWTDPYADIRKERAKKKKAAAAARRRRTSTAASTPVKPARAKMRSNA